MDERRKQFDFWAQDYYEDAWVHLCERTKAALFDCYSDAWQASRQALVVELPSVYVFQGLTYMDADSVKDTFEEIGIKWTE